MEYIVYLVLLTVLTYWFIKDYNDRGDDLK